MSDEKNALEETSVDDLLDQLADIEPGATSQSAPEESSSEAELDAEFDAMLKMVEEPGEETVELSEQESILADEDNAVDIDELNAMINDGNQPEVELESDSAHVDLDNSDEIEELSMLLSEDATTTDAVDAERELEDGLEALLEEPDLEADTITTESAEQDEIAAESSQPEELAIDDDEIQLEQVAEDIELEEPELPLDNSAEIEELSALLDDEETLASNDVTETGAEELSDTGDETAQFDSDELKAALDIATDNQDEALSELETTLDDDVLADENDEEQPQEDQTSAEIDDKQEVLSNDEAINVEEPSVEAMEISAETQEIALEEDMLEDDVSQMTTDETEDALPDLEIEDEQELALADEQPDLEIEEDTEVDEDPLSASTLPEEEAVLDEHPIEDESSLQVPDLEIEESPSETLEADHALAEESQDNAGVLDPFSELTDTLKQIQQSLVKPGPTTVDSAEDQYAKAVQLAKQQQFYQAAKSFRKASMRGHGKAQFYLGLLFLRGDGLPKSFFHAYSWLSLAMLQDVAEAKSIRDQLQPHLTARDINLALRLAADRFEQIEELLERLERKAAR